MAFNSIAYLLFFLIVFSVYWSVRKVQWQNAWILLGSYVFYAWWDVRFLSLIILTSLSSYFTGILIARISSVMAKKMFNVLNILLNIGILFIFKYFNFFIANMEDLLTIIGVNPSSAFLKIAVPAGISFYTFQALSYTTDVYTGRIKAQKNILTFFTFLSFFPQLVAGPIERAQHLMPQIERAKHFDCAEATVGMRRILMGLFKKMVIADNCAPVVELVFSNWQHESSLTLLWGGVLFSMQIYCDFSGYSDIAVGSAKLLGINLVENFRMPYFSTTISDFWRRWHISLMQWFRDYVYIPLGGNRMGARRTYINVFIVFILSGLWHGAAWTFLIWGVYHAFLFIPFRLLKRIVKNQCLMRFVTLGCVMMGWIIFRSDSLSSACGYIVRMFSSFHMEVPPGISRGSIAFFFSCLLLGYEWWAKERVPHLLSWKEMPVLGRRCVYIGMALCIFFLGGDTTSFIYFQF